MRNFYVGSALVCLLLAGFSPGLTAQTTCRAADSESQHFIRVIQAMMTPGSEAHRADRGLPLVSPSQVVLETDPVVCARAGQALAALGRTWDPNAPVLPPSTIALYVIRVGTSYAVIGLESPNDNDADFFFYFGPAWNHTGIGASQ